VYLAGAAAAHLVLRPAENTDAHDGNHTDAKVIAADTGDDEDRDDRSRSRERSLEREVEPSAGSPLTSRASPSCCGNRPKDPAHTGTGWLLSSPDALAERAARVVEVVTTARDGSKFPTVELRALYPARGMLQGEEDVAGHQAGNAPRLCTARPTENTA
jgi:hypothetical protein